MVLKDPEKQKWHSVDFCTMISTNMRVNFSSTGGLGQYGCLLAFPYHQGETHLCEFGIPDLQPEFKTEKIWYGSMGSGQTLTDPFLAFIRKLFWKDGMPNIEEGIFAAVWALQHAIEFNPGGIAGPIDIAVLSKQDNGEFKSHFLSAAEVEEHINNIKEIENKITQHQKQFKSELAKDIPKPPS